MSSKSSNQKHSEKKSKAVESKSTKSSQKAVSTEQPAKETKQSKSKKTTEAVATPAPVVEQKGSSKKSKKSTETVATPAPVVEQKGSSKKSKKATEAAAPVVEESKKSKNTKATAETKNVVVESADNESDDGEKEVSGLRYFKLVYKGNTSGRYSGRKPKQAANKAYSSVIKKEGLQNGGGKIQFSIKECTRGSKQKRYTYDASRVKLDKPVEVNIVGADGKEKNITYNYNNVLQKAKQIIEQDE